MNWVKARKSNWNGNCIQLAWHKPEASGSNGHCVELAWRKASASYNTVDCVEVASCDLVHIADSKNRDAGYHTVTREAFAALVSDIRAGHLDLP